MIFFISGITKATFKESENSAHDKARLQTVVRTGTSSSTHFFSNHVGIGSSTQDLVGDLLTILRTSLQLTGVNSVNAVPENISLV